MEEEGRRAGKGVTSRGCTVMIDYMRHRDFPLCDGPSLFGHSNRPLISFLRMDLSPIELFE